MTVKRTDRELAIAKLERQLAKLQREALRYSHYKGYTAEIRPLYEAERIRLNARLTKLGAQTLTLELPE